MPYWTSRSVHFFTALQFTCFTAQGRGSLSLPSLSYKLHISDTYFTAITDSKWPFRKLAVWGVHFAIIYDRFTLTPFTILTQFYPCDQPHLMSYQELNRNIFFYIFIYLFIYLLLPRGCSSRTGFLYPLSSRRLRVSVMSKAWPLWTGLRSWKANTASACKRENKSQ
jgi:hypothetical protein